MRHSHTHGALPGGSGRPQVLSHKHDMGREVARLHGELAAVKIEYCWLAPQQPLRGRACLLCCIAGCCALPVAGFGCMSRARCCLLHVAHFASDLCGEAHRPAPRFA